MCVGSNPLPVRKRFERDEAEHWADKFSHTGTSIPDDSPKQKKIATSSVVDTRAISKCPKRRIPSRDIRNTDATQLKKHISYRKSRGKPGRMAERSRAPDSRNSSVENSGTRVCAWVLIPLLSENVLNTMRHSLQLTNPLILECQFKMTVLSKKKTKKMQRRLWLIREQFQSAQKGGYPAETLETRMYAWVGTQIFWKGWNKPFSRLHLWIEKFIQLKKHRSYRKKSR